jgi:ABC-type branched-subunit amino acid transport system substrate-binding protein
LGKKILLSGIMLALLAVLTFLVQPPARAQISEVKIGWSMPLSGIPSLVATAKVHHFYYWEVIYDFNRRGGLYVPEAGRRVNITYKAMDDVYDLDKCKANYEWLVYQWGAHILFAPWSTLFNARMMPFFEEKQYPVVGLTVGSDELSKYLMDPHHLRTQRTL